MYERLIGVWLADWLAGGGEVRVWWYNGVGWRMVVNTSLGSWLESSTQACITGARFAPVVYNCTVRRDPGLGSEPRAERDTA